MVFSEFTKLKPLKIGSQSTFHGLPKISKILVSTFLICFIPHLDIFKNRTAEAEPHLHLQLTLQKSLRWIKERWPWWLGWAGSRGGAICSYHLWRSSPSERGFWGFVSLKVTYCNCNVDKIRIPLCRGKKGSQHFFQMLSLSPVNTGRNAKAWTESW